MNCGTRSRGLGWVLCMGLILANARAEGPSVLQQIRPAKTGLSVLVLPMGVTSQEEGFLLASEPWIARTVLVLRNPELSTQKLREILHWKGAADPVHSPGVRPGMPTASKDSYVIMRQQHWKVIEGGDVSAAFVWVHSTNRDAPYFVETQLYREEAGVWYLYSQTRRQENVCQKYPYCVEGAK